MDNEKYRQRINGFSTTEQCDAFIKNARRNGCDELVELAQQRRGAIETAFVLDTSPAEREAWYAIKAYEEQLSTEYGQKMKATRTRQLVAQLGVLPAIEKIVLERAWADDDALGSELYEVGRDEYAFESIVSRYPESFSLQALEIAMHHLEAA